ncbi:uncharacterized protein MYCFIDRAFT_177622 [Pseudocercospora fijiensis CIRAD86]|uniref:Uncharacterized protein n=1 Tax=Pseudocercospora fijiensis (strain CIRAD86) TaxID=383855 RepID=M3AT82_PSEFD|nr:uncharacterized protein MYCFIDRAFT_177622 [Pseudocercospora fijiensis CIRAD86]EME80687.1 hypothetical protein MYCFIDRAFT_177622 [Pseudocercospora fijiensis CIRAD86]
MRILLSCFQIDLQLLRSRSMAVHQVFSYVSNLIFASCPSGYSAWSFAKMTLILGEMEQRIRLEALRLTVVT